MIGVNCGSRSSHHGGPKKNLPSLKYDQDQCDGGLKPEYPSTSPKRAQSKVTDIMTTTATPARPRQAASFTPAIATTSEPQALARLIKQAQTLRLRKQQVLSATPETVMLLRSGIIAAESSASGADRTMVELHFPGDIITSTAIGLAPALIYTSMAATEVSRLSTGMLNDAVAGDAELAGYIVTRMNLQRARLQLHISMLAALTSEQRVAALLLQMASHIGTEYGNSVSFDMPLSRSEVAEYLSLNADTLSRIMARLVREGILARSSRAQITVRNLDALKANCPLSDAVVSLHKAP